MHDDVMKWKHFPHYWPFVLGIHRFPVNSPHKGQWHGALRYSSICVWINGWVKNGEAGDLRRHRAHYDVIVMTSRSYSFIQIPKHNNEHDANLTEIPLVMKICYKAWQVKVQNNVTIGYILTFLLFICVASKTSTHKITTHWRHHQR